MSKKRIVIIGQGEIGKAIKYLLKKTKHNVSIECWDVDVKTCPKRKPLKNIIPEADILFLCIPSWAIHAAGEDIGKWINKQTSIVSLSKGLDRITSSTVDKILKKVFPKNKHIALMSGPMLAEEILQNQPSAAIIASTSKSTQKLLLNIFEPTKLHLQVSKDLRGIALCGILKNIYSLGFGIIQTLNSSDNFRGIYVQKTLEEMEIILAKLGGKKESVCSYAGIGDLVATGFSKHSKNHAYGKALVEEGVPSFDSEGSVSIKPMAEKIEKFRKKLPIFETIYEIVVEEKSPNRIMNIFDKK